MSFPQTTESPPERNFRMLRQFVDPSFAQDLRRRTRLGPLDAQLFPGEGLGDQFARALCELHALPFKELLEGFEFFHRCRKALRAPEVADVCCGHGLVGVLFALFERDVKRVILLDRQRPGSFDRIVEAADRVAPWTRPKLSYVETDLKRAKSHVNSGCSVVAVHACGMRTDRALDLALHTGGPFAAMPCCRPHRQHPAPDGLKRALGADLAIDVHRSYQLEEAGYRVRWDAIPAAITSHPRMLTGAPRRSSASPG